MGLHSKLLEVQNTLAGTLTFDAKNPHFKNSYITLNKLLGIVLPELSERGILLMQPLTEVNGSSAIQTAFIDVETGEIIERSIPLVLEKTSPQAVGSSITYFRRYGILSALGLVADEDDDAEASTGARHVAEYGANKSSPDAKANF